VNQFAKLVLRIAEQGLYMGESIGTIGELTGLRGKVIRDREVCNFEALGNDLGMCRVHREPPELTFLALERPLTFHWC
jgi:hypothetical protein